MNRNPPIIMEMPETAKYGRSSEPAGIRETDTRRETNAADPLALADVPFLLHKDTKKRFGGALGTSVAVHLGLLALAFTVSQIPQAQEFIQDTPIAAIFLPQEGPGGGGGGGGNEMPAPPKKAEVPPPEKAPVVPAPQPRDIPKPETELQAPIVTPRAELPIAGILEGLPKSESQGPGTGGGGGTGRGTGTGPGQGPGVGPGFGGGFGGGAYRPGSGVTTPSIRTEVKPAYTAEAMRAKVQGVVELEAVVLPDGTVGDVHITRSLDPVFGLDQEAIKAVKKWRFNPGMRQGQPVPVLVTIELTFTLR